MKDGNIAIFPFNIEHLGSNSYDVHLGKTLAVYDSEVLDAKKHNKINCFDIPEEGFVLHPNTLYLGSTIEYTETLGCVPILEGKSSIGRLGISIHITAGLGDVNFKGNWVLEIMVIHPVRVYAGMPIGQLVYHTVKGDVINPYHTKKSAKYNHQSGMPVESMMFKNFQNDNKGILPS